MFKHKNELSVGFHTTENILFSTSKTAVAVPVLSSTGNVLNVRSKTTCSCTIVSLCCINLSTCRFVSIKYSKLQCYSYAVALSSDELAPDCSLASGYFADFQKIQRVR